jgi:hypothetical protein
MLSMHYADELLSSKVCQSCIGPVPHLLVGLAVLSVAQQKAEGDLSHQRCKVMRELGNHTQLPLCK